MLRDITAELRLIEVSGPGRFDKWYPRLYTHNNKYNNTLELSQMYFSLHDRESLREIEFCFIVIRGPIVLCLLKIFVLLFSYFVN